MSETQGVAPPRHFTVQTLARYWGVSPSHIYNLIHSNAIRHMRIGKAIRIPSIFVKEFEEAACQTSVISTVSGSTTTELGTLSGLQRLEKKRQGALSAYQQGVQTAARQNNIAPNSSQD